MLSVSAPMLCIGGMRSISAPISIDMLVMRFLISGRQTRMWCMRMPFSTRDSVGVLQRCSSARSSPASALLTTLSADTPPQRIRLSAIFDDEALMRPAFMMLVCTKVGHSAVTRIGVSASSAARVSVTASTAALLAL